MNLLSAFGSHPALRLVALGIVAPAAGFLLSLLLCRISRRGSAAVRHLLWLLAFVLMAVSIPITLLHLRVAVPMLPAISAALTPAPGGSLAPMLPSAPAESPARDAIFPAHIPLIAPGPSHSAPALHPPDWPGLLLALWATGFFLSLIPVLAGILRVRRIVERSGIVIDRPVAELWSELCASGGRKQRTRLFVSSEVSVPFAAGWLRPAVTLPHGALGWPSDLLRAALIHELAHITRNDLVSFAFARLVASLYWFHPLAWRGLRALSAEAEMAADDVVVVTDARPAAYAESLVKLARAFRENKASAFPAMGIVRGGSIQARVEGILDHSRPRLAPRRLVRLGALSGVVLVTSAVLMVRPVAALPPPARAGLLAVAGADPLKPDGPPLTLPPQELLGQAIAENDLARARQALTLGADPSAASFYAHTGGNLAYSTPLYFAAEQGSLPLARLLVEHGASVKPGKSTWENAVDAALRNGFIEVARYLHEQGATSDPLAYAAGTGDLDTLKQLAAGASPKLLADAAITAAGCGKIGALGQLLGEKGDPVKAFQRAASNGAIETMQFLLDRKLDLKAAGDEALRKAAYKGQARAVEFLLKAGVKPNPEKHLEDTALHEAASVGAVDCARLLLAAGADPNSLTEREYDKGSTPLFSVCTGDNEDIARLLLDHGARMDIVNQRGFTPVLYAASAHAPRCLALLMDRGADLKAVNPVWESGLMKFAMIFNGEDAERPDLKMIKALILRDIETVKVLLDKGMDVNAPDPTDGLTPLSIAVSNGQTACLEMLLQRGAKMNTVDRFGATPLIRLIQGPVKEEWRLTVLGRLLALGADPNLGIDNPIAVEHAAPSALKAALFGGFNQLRSTVTFEALIQARRKVLGVLLAHGARFPVEKNSDAEEMLLAATTGDLATVRRLLAAGVSPNVADRRGWTPLLSASALGDSAILHALVNAGADVNLRDAMDLTALQFAARRYPDLTDFRFLLDKGADVNNEGKGILDAPVLFTAISHGDPALTLELLQRGAHPNRSPTTVSNLLDPIEHAVDLLGRQASDEKRREIVKLLLRFGADPNLKRTNSRSLLYYPVAGDNVALVKFLLDAGIDPRKDHDGGKAVAEQAERYGSKEMKALVKAALAPAAR